VFWESNGKHKSISGDLHVSWESNGKQVYQRRLTRVLGIKRQTQVHQRRLTHVLGINRQTQFISGDKSVLGIKRQTQVYQQRLTRVLRIKRQTQVHQRRLTRVLGIKRQTQVHQPRLTRVLGIKRQAQVYQRRLTRVLGSKRLQRWLLATVMRITVFATPALNSMKATARYTSTGFDLGNSSFNSTVSNRPVAYRTSQIHAPEFRPSPHGIFCTCSYAHFESLLTLLNPKDLLHHLKYFAHVE
jgi:flagellar biosynthesis/type III secretory pathway ATPase